jgi:trans-aconitate methyltransferase
VLELLNPQPGERILDLGCGDGALTEKLAAAGAQIVGVDASQDMVTAAIARGIDARVMNASELGFDCEFDAVFSNAVLHWIKDNPDAVIQGVSRALRTGGRFAAEMGGHGCVAAITVALCATLREFGVADPSGLLPWYFPTVPEYRQRLERSGLRVEYIQLIPRPTLLPTGIRGWLETFATPFTRSLPAERRSAFLDSVTEQLRPVLCDSTGQWTADYIRLRFLARK